MLIQRWQASTIPSIEQLKVILQNEGLEYEEENLEPGTKFQEHRHPFNEIRVVVSGELLFNVGGTQLILRAGDRIEIAANTKHFHLTQKESCMTLFGKRPF